MATAASRFLAGDIGRRLSRRHVGRIQIRENPKGNWEENIVEQIFVYLTPFVCQLVSSLDELPDQLQVYCDLLISNDREFVQVDGT